MTRQVVSVSGPPGAGKSTLARRLAASLGADFVQYDDFEIITSWPPERVENWLDRGSPFDEAIAPGLYEHLLGLDGLVVFETPFGRACPQIGPMIDASVWLDCPLDLALARKLSTLVQSGGGDPHLAAILSGWLGAYEGFTRRALLVQGEKVRPLADLHLSATEAPENIVSSVLSFINRHLAP